MKRESMQLKLRPMSEAPANEWLLTRRRDGKDQEFDAVMYRSVELFKSNKAIAGDRDFWRVPDLIHAAETMAAITPEGCKYDHHDAYCAQSGTGTMLCRGVHFRRIAPPVEYQYIAEHKYRAAKVGDFLLQGDGDWVEVDESLARVCGDEPRLCFRRVEVKR